RLLRRSRRRGTSRGAAAVRPGQGPRGRPLDRGTALSRRKPRARVTRGEALALLVIGAVLLAWSGIAPADRTTWILEVFPIFIAVPLLVVTARRFPLTPLAYRLIFVHALILMLGGHYTYAQVPLGFWMQRVFGFSRNHYDRIGHLAQGFVPAFTARARQVALLHRPERLPRDQRLLRVHRVVVGVDWRQRCRRVSRHAGRS